MNFGTAMATTTVAAVLRFLDPWTSVEQTDDAAVAAAWAHEDGYWQVPMGVADPLAKPPEETLWEKIKRHAMRREWKAPPPETRVVHALFRVYDETPEEYDAAEASPLFKVNQVGYLPGAPKYAYIGAWLGPGLGPWTPRGMGGWKLVDAATGETVKESETPPRMRPMDSLTKEEVPWTGEETYEMDFSDVDREGEYYLEVEGVGRSRTFKIRRGAAEEAFRVHMGGLYQKRCGIAKEEPWTHWTAGACHTEVTRGTFAPEEGKLSPKTRWFEIIRHNTDWENGEQLELVGGWHDAADYDRRPVHLNIVNELCAVWAMRPKNFSDGQLWIPESTNGIPDILDEAEWGLRHLLAGQQKDGGVGTWVESTRHPGAGNVAEKDTMRYALSAATRRSSLMYAACASLLMRCEPRFKEKYLESAERAWNFALGTEPRTVMYMVPREENRWLTTQQAVYWDEPKELPVPWLVKAAVNLHALTGDEKYLAALDVEELKEKGGRDAWSWDALTFSGEMALGTPPELDALFGAWRKRVKANASKMCRVEEEDYPYRTPWRSPGSSWVQSIGYGQAHPLVQARWLVAAHALTGEQKYWDAASVANDFHNGCNPMGSTMTSGLGDVYPVAFLDLPSYVDGIAEYVPGITPYRWTYRLPNRAVELIWKGNRALASEWPQWRRFANVEASTPGASEYTVADTIAPAACVTGYLMEEGAATPAPKERREPAKSLRELEGYWALP
jgi:endoglucanase